MDRKEPNLDNSSASLINQLGENYYYLKTIILNRIEISKLELLQFFSIIISKLITGLVFSILILIATLFCLIALVLYVATLVGSHIYALLIVALLIVLIGILFYILVSPILSNFIVCQIEEIDFLTQTPNDVEK
jgi:hypothetical protein